jgi:hypothetical protein
VDSLRLTGRVEGAQEPDPAPLAQEVVLEALHPPPIHSQTGQSLVPAGKSQGQGKPLPSEVQKESAEEGI